MLNSHRLGQPAVPLISVYPIHTSTEVIRLDEEPRMKEMSRKKNTFALIWSLDTLGKDSERIVFGLKYIIDLLWLWKNHLNSLGFNFHICKMCFMIFIVLK